MNLPKLQQIVKNKRTIGNFGGLNESLILNENEFSKMKNICSDMYPGITCRKQRGDPIAKLERPFGLYWKNGLFWVNGGNTYYKGEYVGFYPDEKERTLVGLGAYICSFPDGSMFSTVDKKFRSMTATWRGDVTVEPVSEGSTFVRITGSGIGNEFASGDGVEFSGFVTHYAALNGTKILKEVGSDFVVVIAVDAGDPIRRFTNGNITLTRKVPEMDFVCEFNNRLWGCSNRNHEIYASKLGDPTNWNAFEGLSTDSYALTVGSDGDFTGCLAHNGYVVFFKEDCIHTIYGSKPSNFTLDTVQARGPAKGCEKSLCNVNESVFYVSRNGVCIYEGSLPETVSTKLSGKWKAASGQQYDSKYYVSVQDMAGNWRLLVYDMRRSAQNQAELWYQEDEEQMKYSCYAEGKLYIVDRNNMLREIYAEKEEDYIEWNLESGDLEEGTLSKKKPSRMQLSIDLTPNAVLTLYVSYDNSPTWIRVKTITADARRNYQIPIKLKRCDRYRFKIRGRGKFRLYGMSRTTEGGSDR